MGEKHIDTKFLDEAIIFATNAHAGVERRGKGFPYIVHPLEVVAIVSTMTADQELLAAAALHDVVEDTDIGLDVIREKFGDRVARIVESESDKFDPNLSLEASWKGRKAAAIARIKNSSRESKIVALGDKLSNMRAIYRDFKTMGPAIWNIFHEKDPKEHEWHYRGLVDSLSELKDTFAFKEFSSLVDEVFSK